ncbi:MAG: hypothetical protein OXH76_04945 [Boseongicola sp.]|nr:hypothetical protein [Boseongicola sp.]
MATRRGEIAELCRSHRGLRHEVFGSAAHGTGFDPASSDADFLAEFGKSSGSGGLRRHFAFQEALAAVLDREADLSFGPAERQVLFGQHQRMPRGRP